MPVETLFGRRPPQTPENSITTANNQFFENVLQLRALYRLRQRYTNLPPQDRFTSSQESQEPVFPSSGSISFKNDFEHIDDLHLRFGIRGNQRLAHDPVKDRARYERAKNDQERQAVKKGVIAGTKKTLYERAHTAQSTVTYYQDNEGRIYDPDHLGESIDVVFQRGLEDSRRNGFVDYERELAEFEGWKEVMAKLFTPQIPTGSKEIVISGPGFKKGTAFTDNLVDIFTKAIDPATGRVVVIMARFACGSSYDEYRKIAARLNSNYFNSEDPQEDEQAEIFFKAHPIFIDSRVDSRTDEELFSEEFIKQKGVTEEEKTRHCIDECRLFILQYAETICSSFFDPENVKIAFNAVINKFDAVRKGAVEKIKNITKGILKFGRTDVSIFVDKTVDFFRSLKEEINYYGRMKVEEIMVGCGLSGGFSVGGIFGSLAGSIKSFISRVIGGIVSFVSGGETGKKGKCIRCGEVNYCTKKCYKCDGMLI